MRASGGPADRAAWACSSVVEHCVDIAGVASSILATPTIFPHPPLERAFGHEIEAMRLSAATRPPPDGLSAFQHRRHAIIDPLHRDADRNHPARGHAAGGLAARAGRAVVLDDA